MGVWSWRGAASISAYVVIAAVIGRAVLAHLGTHVANDLGDPLLTAAILHWNATHLPWTDAWYQLPIFFPAADVLAFSEHLLGLSVVAAPLQWVSGNPLVAYNVTMLLTAVLSAAAMWALTWRLTGDAIAAFLAGLAFGFAPYRVSQFPHVQMLATFYAPLALLGLHAYLDTGRRAWLVLYGAAWTLQAAANGYMLVFFSILVGLWAVWFVAARRKWRELGLIALTTAIAILPLIPILVRYIRVHQFHGFVRGEEEIRMFSADLTALLCAPKPLTFWGWFRFNCAPEGELFPGLVVSVLCIAAAAHVLGWRSSVPVQPRRAIRVLTGLLVAAATAYLLIAASVAWLGPWRLQLGPLRATASIAGKPLVIGLAALAAALLVHPRVHAAVRASSTMAFYLAGAAAMWLLALGPRPRLNGTPVEFNGPFASLMLLPGGDSLRVPARFWIVATLCLAVVAGLFVARVLKGKNRGIRGTALMLLSAGLLSDGWASVPAVRVGTAAPGRALAGQNVLVLPMTLDIDLAASYDAITGGWNGINGYSGFFPLHYLILRDALSARTDAVWEPLQARGTVAVVVYRDAPEDEQWVRRQPGATVTGEDRDRVRFLLPSRARPSRAGAVAVPVRSVMSACNPAGLHNVLDGNARTQWVCGPVDAEQSLTIDLGTPETVGAVGHGSAAGLPDYPRLLRIDTSVDGTAWTPAWQGDTAGVAVEAALADPRVLRLLFVFEPRAARYIRITHPNPNGDYTWSAAELQVWTR